MTAGKIAELSDRLFSKNLTFSENEIEEFSDLLPNVPLGVSIVDDLVATGLAPSKSEARNLVNAGAISVNGEKVLDETKVINFPAVIKKGKNKFAVIC